MHKPIEERIEDLLQDNGYDTVDFSMKVFKNPDYFDSIVGLTDDNRLVYDYDSMLEELIKNNGMSLEEASDFLNYSTLRSLRYPCNEDKPIIMYKLER